LLSIFRYLSFAMTLVLLQGPGGGTHSSELIIIKQVNGTKDNVRSGEGEEREKRSDPSTSDGRSMTILWRRGVRATWCLIA
jgi:hypothetical protein